MTVTGRKHNTDDIIATVLAVEPMKFIYRGRIAVFSIRVLRDERICVVAEQRPDCSEEEVSLMLLPFQSISLDIVISQQSLMIERFKIFFVVLLFRFSFLVFSYFQSFQWMSRVLQAVDSIHQVGLYCLALVPHNHLPKTPLGLNYFIVHWGFFIQTSSDKICSEQSTKEGVSESEFG